MTAVLTEFLGILSGGISTLGQAIGTGLKDTVVAMFLETGTNGVVEGLSTFGGVAAVFAGVALAIGLTTRVFTWVTSLGN